MELNLVECASKTLYSSQHSIVLLKEEKRSPLGSPINKESIKEHDGYQECHDEQTII
jgi:hypothetical protein